MNDDEGIREHLAKHIDWCREERDRLTEVLERHQAGTGGLSDRSSDDRNQSEVTHLLHVQRTIEQLNRVVAAFADSHD